MGCLSADAVTPHLHQELRRHGKTAIAWRAAILLTACCIVLAIDCHAHAENPNRLRLIVTHTASPLVPDSVMDLADTLGFYRREGLALEIVHSCTATERHNPPNTYEVPGCQETDNPYERIFSHFFRFVCSESIVTWQHVLT